MDKNTTKWTKEKQSEYYKEWRKKNKERLAEYQKKWHEDNKDHIQQYLEDNKEKISKKSKEWRENNPNLIKQLWQDWYKKNKERSPRRRFTEAKSTAKKRDIEWSLTFEEYANLIMQPCYYCNNKFGEPVKRSTGLDRMDSNIGYINTNVVSCCNNCNVMKNTFLSPEETKIAVAAVLAFRASKIISEVLNTQQ